jgi:DNA-binding transcriptional MerR regulator
MTRAQNRHLTLDLTPGCKLFHGDAPMHIGRVAKKIGLTPDAIRFYERNSLLPHPTRSAGGFRQYADSDLETLRFIRQAQHLGFSLKEVRELVALRSSRLQPCAPVCLRVEKKLLQVRQKLSDLRRLQRELQKALHICRKELHRKNGRCPLLSGAKQNRREQNCPESAA